MGVCLYLVVELPLGGGLSSTGLPCLVRFIQTSTTFLTLLENCQECENIRGGGVSSLPSIKNKSIQNTRKPGETVLIWEIFSL